MLIKGIISKGMNGANRALKRQKKIFSKQGLPGIENTFTGTINLNISPLAIEYLKYDYFFEDIVFKKFPRKRIESFGFLKITKLIYKDKEYPDWGYVYVPLGSPHVTNKSMLELVGKELKNIELGEEIVIEVDSKLVNI